MKSTGHLVQRRRGTTQEPGLGWGPVHEFLVAGLLLGGSGRAKPERKKEGQPPVGPPPVGGTMRDRCKEDRAADGGGDLDNMMLQLDLPNTISYILLLMMWRKFTFIQAFISARQSIMLYIVCFIQMGK
ncbi:hypothetical protein XENOCAPTIV_001461 [Xenoophorus captivus]|uniref:Uncharacterized protein n=1 Tax=Xenoophorus captivus TaxID=1517983 RepID=A0ABV0QCL9_9TELE